MIYRVKKKTYLNQFSIACYFFSIENCNLIIKNVNRREIVYSNLYFLISTSFKHKCPDVITHYYISLRYKKSKCLNQMFICHIAVTPRITSTRSRVTKSRSVVYQSQIWSQGHWYLRQSIPIWYPTLVSQNHKTNESRKCKKQLMDDNDDGNGVA